MTKKLMKLKAKKVIETKDKKVMKVRATDE